MLRQYLDDDDDDDDDSSPYTPFNAFNDYRKKVNPSVLATFFLYHYTLVSIYYYSTSSRLYYFPILILYQLLKMKGRQS